ncbi:YheU family protein [Legionella sp.]|uniref:YheU family protein n=1 Tax=Legionella sp. TaxID=459 RepID=UPI00321FDED6
MIEIDYSLLSQEALDNLISEVITRQSTDYGEQEVSFITKKAELLQKLESGEAIIVYHSKEGICDIIGKEFKAL